MRALLQMYLDDPTVDVDAKFELYWLQPQEGSDALADFLVQAVAAPQMLADLVAANAGLLRGSLLLPRLLFLLEQALVLTELH